MDVKKYLNIFVFEDLIDCYPNAVTVAQYYESNKIDGHYYTHRSSFDNKINFPNQAGVFADLLTHELGHFFGLNHLNGPGNFPDSPEIECHAEEDCLTEGDWVCDTYIFSNNYTEDSLCGWTNHCPNGDNPIQRDNFMVHNTGGCLKKYTNGQIALMRFTIQYAGLSLVSPANIAAVAPTTTYISGNHYGSDNIISSDSTWASSSYNVIGNIRIQDGASLTINSSSTVKMNENAMIIVEPGGELKLFGMIKNGCNTSWAGIEVQGDKIISGIVKKGNLLAYSGSVIENAHMGIKLYGPKISDVGGKTLCEGLTIKNCKTGVDIQPYLPNENKFHSAIFRSCSFITDHNYPFAENAFVHINLRSVKGIGIYGCTFTNTRTPFSPSGIQDYGYGIKSTDGGFTLDQRCVLNNSPSYECDSYIKNFFTGLGYGVYVGKDRGSNPFMIMSSYFTDCYYGGLLNNTSFGTVLFNRFRMGNLPDKSVSSDKQVGIMFESQTLNLIFEENTFVKITGNSPDTYGTIAQHMDVQNRIFRRNSYSGLTYANIANGINASETGIDGLVYNCNTNYSNTYGDFIMPATGDIVSQQQGWADGGPVYKAAGNTFSHSNELNNSDFQNYGTSSNPLSWRNYYFNQNSLPQTPLYYFQIIPIARENNGCLQKYCESPCLTPPTKVPDIMFLNGGTELPGLKLVYASTQTSYHDLLARTQDPSLAERRYYESLLTDQAGDVIRYMLNDTLHNYLDSVAAWALQLNTPAGDWYAADVYRNMGQGVTATSVINAIGTRFSGLIDVPKYNTQKTLFGLISSAQPGLTPSSLLTSYTSGSGYMRSIATSFQISRGEFYDPYFWVGSVNFRYSEERQAIKVEPKLVVYPNPTTGIVMVDIGMTVTGGILTVYNTLGEAVMSIEIDNNQHFHHLDLSSKPAGQYYVSLYKDYGKVVKESFILVR